MDGDDGIFAHPQFQPFQGDFALAIFRTCGGVGLGWVGYLESFNPLIAVVAVLQTGRLYVSNSAEKRASAISRHGERQFCGIPMSFSSTKSRHQRVHCAASTDYLFNEGQGG